jgi:hypothetical protein
MRCRGLHKVANPPYLSGFLCSGLLRVAPYCVPGGVRVVSSDVSFQVLAGSIGGLKLVRALIRTPRGETTRGRRIRDSPTAADRDLDLTSGDYRLFRTLTTPSGPHVVR